jgi:hypothetical protein
VFGRKRKRTDRPVAARDLGEVHALDRIAPPRPIDRSAGERRPRGAPEDPADVDGRRAS